MTFTNVLLVGAGGFFGSIARYLTVILVDKKMNSAFPYGTLAVNVVGCFVLGVVMGQIIKGAPVPTGWKVFLTTGFCGGFTTFSAFAFENLTLVHQKMPGTSAIYILVSLLLGFLAVGFGAMLGRNI